jgi:hypothetical protein
MTGVIYIVSVGITELTSAEGTSTLILLYDHSIKLSFRNFSSSQHAYSVKAQFHISLKGYNEQQWINKMAASINQYYTQEALYIML